MHWYAFQMLTMRSVCSSRRRDLQRRRAARSQRSRRAAKRVVDRAGVEVALDRPGWTRVLLMRLRAGRVELLVASGSRRSPSTKTISRVSPGLPASSVTWWAPIGCPAVGDRVRTGARVDGLRAVPAAVRPEECLALRCRSRPAAPSRRSRRSGRAARGTRSCGRSHRRRPRPRRSSSCAGSSWRRPARPTGRTRPPRTATGRRCRGARWSPAIRQISRVSPERHEIAGLGADAPRVATRSSV